VFTRIHVLSAKSGKTIHALTIEADLPAVFLVEGIPSSPWISARTLSTAPEYRNRYAPQRHQRSLDGSTPGCFTPSRGRAHGSSAQLRGVALQEAVDGRATWEPIAGPGRNRAQERHNALRGRHRDALARAIPLKLLRGDVEGRRDTLQLVGLSFHVAILDR
jgi:hypothetical protein